jgi:DnaJ-class molecular chaperone
MTYTNRYQGTCHYCGTHVPAGAGAYDYGKVSCTEYIYTAGSYTEYFCLVTYNTKYGTAFATRDEAQQHAYDFHDAAIATTQETVRQSLVDGGLADYATRANVKSLAQVIIKITGEDIAIEALTFDQITDVRNELQKRINRKAAAKRLEPFKASNTCNRCGGAGEADKWHHTGRVCYQCGGTGKYYKI